MIDKIVAELNITYFEGSLLKSNVFHFIALALLMK